jgi:hypothetical protein
VKKAKIQLQVEPQADAIAYVCRHMRQRDQKEIFATRWDGNPEAMAVSVGMTGAMTWCVWVDGKPAALFGATPRWPGVWSVWAFGTDDWPKAVRTVTKQIRRFLVPALRNNPGVHRVDCFALAEYTETGRWLQSFGLEPANTLDSWGKHGETFVLYTWTRKDQTGQSPALPPR